MDILIWVVTGVFVGWVVRLAMRSRHDFGLVGNLVTGSLGAVVGGWLLELAGVTAPGGWLAHALVAIVGAMVLLGAVRVLHQAVSIANRQSGNLIPSVADFETQMAKLGDIERRVFATLRGRGATPVDPNRSFDAQMSFGERVADRVAAFGGSWTFIGLFLTLMLVWMAVNQRLRAAFDPYPFILLNLVLSCLAALQAPVIMMSQNRQAAKDRSDARLDYEVNVRAEIQIAALHEKVDGTRANDLARITAQLDEHRLLLAAIEKQLAGRLPAKPEDLRT
jgi:uncharacterized membrane protein/uncharacterized membrane protein YeaQ/YmgE (transglycosylase-associated protein family)